MKKSRRHPPHIDLPMKLNIAILIAFSVMIFWGIFLVRDKLLQNSHEMGTYLARSYATEEENRISIYKMLMNLGGGYFEEKISSGADSDELQQWLADYFRHLSTVLQTELLDPYAVVDGSIIAATPWEGDASYEYRQAEWYRRALEAGGEIIFTDAYQDAITGRYMITISMQLADTDDVLAFDVFLDNFHSHKNKASMPDGSSYFLFDGSGALMYIASDLQITDPQVQDYASRLLDSIEDGSLSSYNETIRGLDGKQRGVYYHRMDNGWVSVITIPVAQILQGDIDRIMILLVFICTILLLAVLAVLIRSYFGDRQRRRSADIIQILGDSYYAIYRIDYAAETYETVKGSEDVRETLGTGGDYRLLIRTVRELVDKKTYEEFEQCFSIENIKRLLKNEIYDFGGDYQRRFGNVYKWVNIRLIFNKAPDSHEVLLCFREIESEKHQRLQQQLLLETSLEAAKKTSRDKTIFFSNISHDMRTPLNAIIGLSRLAQQNQDDLQKVHEYMEKIEQSGQQLLTLINDILDMSKLEQGVVGSLDCKPTNLEQCLKDCVGLFTEQAKEEDKHLYLEIRLRDATVMCDAFRLSQIINNLISNAMKYSRAGADITVRLEQLEHQDTQSRYQLMVEDTGVGMSEEFLSKIFEPFARETLFSPAGVTGTGLGMPIVKNLVQQMNGEITVRSALGKGTAFTITFPFQIIDAQKEAPAAQEEEVFDLQNINILLVEDNEINMEITTEFLTMAGAEIAQAWNGREALELFRSSPVGFYDFILLDMQMPEMDGCTACQEIRALDRPDAAAVPIIAVTANAFAEDVARTTAAGMNAHISKPIDFELLFRLLGSLSHSDDSRIS